MTAETRPRLWSALSWNLVAEVALRAPQLFWSLWAARVLSRWELGVWSAFHLLLQLCPYLAATVLNGLELRYGFLVGGGRAKDARATVTAAWVSASVLSVALALLLSIGFAIAPIRARLVPGARTIELAIFLAIVLLQAQHSFLVTHLRTRLRFGRVNGLLLAGSALGVLVLVATLGRLRVTGALLAMAITHVVTVAALPSSVDAEGVGRVKLRPEIATLARIGVVLTAAWFGLDVFRLLARWIILHRLGVEALGTYATAFVFAGAVFLAGTSSSRVLMQFATRAAGARRADAEDLLFRPAVAVVATSAFFALAASFAARVFLPWWAPHQSAALGIVRPAIYGSLWFALIHVCMTMLRASGRIRPLATALAIALSTHLLVLFGVGFAGFGLRTLVAAEAASFALVLVLVVVGYPQLFAARRARFLRCTALVHGITIASLEGGASFASRSVVSPIASLAVEVGFALAGAALWVPVIVRTLREPSDAQDRAIGASFAPPAPRS
jgi:O-antigen/teichoic acid export membrane protein